MKKLRVAVVGAKIVGSKYSENPRSANIGYHHARNIQQSGLGEIVAISRTYNDGAVKTAEEFNRLFNANCVGYSNPVKMFDNEKPDLVYICTPPEFHLPLVEEALDQGIHVVCEKPLAYPDLGKKEEILEHARRLIRYAENHGLYFGVVKQFVTLTDPIKTILKEQNGKSEIQNLSMFIESQGGKTGKEIIIDLYPHSILREIIGKKDKISDPFIVKEREDLWLLGFKYNSCKCDIELSESKSKEERKPNYIEINNRLKIEFTREVKGEDFQIVLRYIKDGRLGSLEVGDPLRNLDEAILSYLLDKRRKPLVTAKQGLSDLEDIFTFLELVPEH